ncbi:MAG: diacylglycerol/lipid kinase family protein, partial [Verrucomicrobiales bacterium]
VCSSDLEALESPAEFLILGGGDGTLSRSVGRLAGSGKVLGVLPLGTFNLAARDLSLPLDPLKAAEELLRGEVGEIDILRVNEHCCLCATVFGFYPALAKKRESYHGQAWWLKSLRIAYELAFVATKSRALRMELRGGGERRQLKTRLAAFSPGRYEDEFGLIPRRKDLAAGELFAYISRGRSRWDLLREGCKFLLGKVFDPEEMVLMRGRELELRVKGRRRLEAMIDGEILEVNLPCRLRIEAKALRVLRVEGGDEG